MTRNCHIASPLCMTDECSDLFKLIITCTHFHRFSRLDVSFSDVVKRDVHHEVFALDFLLNDASELIFTLSVAVHTTFIHIFQWISNLVIRILH